MKNGQILQNDEMRFFIASAVKKWPDFQNWPWNGQSGNPGTEVITVTFLTPVLTPKKLTLAPAPELIGNLHSDSCLHSKSLKAESILPHKVK